MGPGNERGARERTGGPESWIVPSPWKLYFNPCPHPNFFRNSKELHFEICKVGIQDKDVQHQDDNVCVYVCTLVDQHCCSSYSAYSGIQESTNMPVKTQEIEDIFQKIQQFTDRLKMQETQRTQYGLQLLTVSTEHEARSWREICEVKPLDDTRQHLTDACP